MKPQFEDPQFRKWLNIVSPTTLVADLVMASVDWNTILELLLAIFKILLGLGCFAKARATTQVKAAMKLSSRSEAEAGLRVILSQLQTKQKGRTMKSLILVLALLPAMLFASVAPVKGVYSVKYKRKFYLGLAPHAKITAAGKDRRFLDASVKVPNDFYMPSKWPLPPGLPYDQKSCGSCVVNAIAGQATYQLSIRGMLPLTSSPLSRGQTMECNPSAGQCNGDYAENVGGWVVGHGALLSELVYPYHPQNGRCKNISGAEYGPFKSGSVINGSPESIGKAMVMGVPPSTTVGAGGAWMDYQPSDYTDGVFTACSNISTNHETLLIGIHCRGAAKGADGFCDFAAAKNGDIVYDMLNSWGQWGDKGILHTVAFDSRGRRCNNIAEEVYALDTGTVVPPEPEPTPNPPTPVPPTPDPVPSHVNWMVVLGVVLAGVAAFIVYLVVKK